MFFISNLDPTNDSMNSKIRCCIDIYRCHFLGAQILFPLLTPYSIPTEQWSRTFSSLPPVGAVCAAGSKTKIMARQVSFEEAFTYCTRPEVVSVLQAYGSLL